MKGGIVVAGPIILDHHFEIECFPQEGELATVLTHYDEMGGTGNVLGSIARLDSHVDLFAAGNIGLDEDGQKIQELIKRNFPSINLEATTVAGKTAYTIIIDSKDSKERTFFSNLGDCSNLNDSNLQWQKFDGSLFLLEYLLMGYSLDSLDKEYGTHSARILKHAKERGMITSVDLVSNPCPDARRICLDVFKFVDICAVNEIEAQASTGISFPTDGNPSEVRKILDAIENMGVSKWVIIHTPRICYGLDVASHKYMQIHTMDLPSGFIKGKTGAGDAFLAGILYSAWLGQPLEKALICAIGTASSSLAGTNGTDTVIAYEHLSDFMFEFGFEGKIENL